MHLKLFFFVTTGAKGMVGKTGDTGDTGRTRTTTQAPCFGPIGEGAACWGFELFD